MPKNFTLTVTPYLANVAFSPIPPIASLYIGNEQVIVSQNPTNATYNYTVSAPGYTTQTGSFVIDGTGEATAGLVNLIPNTGTAVITINVVPAQNGIPITPPPSLAPGVSSGGTMALTLKAATYSFVVSASGCNSKTVPITVVGGVNATYTVYLEKILPVVVAPPTGSIRVVPGVNPWTVYLYDGTGAGPISQGTWDASLSTQITISNLAPGPYMVGVKYLNNPLVKKPVTVVASTSTDVLFSLADFTPPPPVPTPTGTLFSIAQLATNTDVPGVLRGAYRADNNDNHYDQWEIPGYDYFTEYFRYDWSSIETAQGVYSGTASIINDISAAKSRGRTHAFGFTLFNPDGDSAYPSWLPVEFVDPVTSVRWPQYNSSAFVNGVKNLVAAVANAISAAGLTSWVEYVDARTWGSWGEGHNYRGGATPASTAMTLANKQSLIDAYIAAFPNTIMVAMTDDTESLNYATQATSGAKWRFGLRRDSFSWTGGTWGFNWIDYGGWTQETIDRWKYSPFVVENGGNFGGQDWTAVMGQVTFFHLAALKDANHGHVFATWANPDRQEWLDSVAASGFRLGIDSVTYPTTAAVGASLPVTLVWNSQGVTPLYRDYTVQLLLVPATGSPVVVNSVAVLKGLLPGNKSTVVDNIPTAGLSAGTYTLMVRGIDAAGIRKKLGLCIVGKNAGGTYDGAYTLGTITLS